MRRYLANFPVPSLLLISTLICVFAAPAADAGIDIPREVQLLVPETAIAVVAFSSLDEIESKVNELAAAMDEPQDQDLLAEMGFPAADLVDRSRAIVAAFGMPSMTGEGPPPMTFLMPLLDDDISPDDLAEMLGLPWARIESGYAVVSTTLEYEAAPGIPALIQDLPPGNVVARVNLAALIEEFMPMIEMMTEQMQQAALQDPSAVPGAPSPKEAASLADLITRMASSLNLLELGVGLDQGRLDAILAYEVHPGSALDMGPQPVFADAYALTRYLPEDALYTQVVGADFSALIDRFPGIWTLGMQGLMEEMDESVQETLGAWMQQAYELEFELERVSAIGMDLDEAGVEFVMLSRVNDPTGMADRMHAHTMALAEFGLGMGATLESEGQVESARARSYSLQWDYDQLMSALPDSLRGEPMSASDADEFNAFMAAFMQTLWIASSEDAVVLTFEGSEGKLLKKTLAAMRDGSGQTPARVEELRAWAGPEANLLAACDFRTLMASVMAWVKALGLEEPTPDFDLDGPPLEFVVAGEFQATRFATRIGFDAIPFFEFLASLEDENAHGPHDKGIEHHDGEE